MEKTESGSRDFLFALGRGFLVLKKHCGKVFLLIILADQCQDNDARAFEQVLTTIMPLRYGLSH